MNINYTEVAQKVIENVGGIGNINVAAHCVTRIKIKYIDISKVNSEALRNVSEIKGHFFSGGFIQLIVGTSQVHHLSEALKDCGVKFEDLTQARTYQAQTPHQTDSNECLEGDVQELINLFSAIGSILKKYIR